MWRVPAAADAAAVHRSMLLRDAHPSATKRNPSAFAVDLRAIGHANRSGFTVSGRDGVSEARRHPL
jgi:hypothetical protein